MAHQRKISRGAPGFIIMDIDDSGSMGDLLAGTTDAKYLWVERYIGILLQQLLAFCTDGSDGTVIRPRYYLHLIRYGSSPSVWGNGEMDIQSGLELYAKAGNSLGLGGHLGGTDAAAAFRMVHDVVKNAVASERFRDSFPPMVFHLTDGESQTDAQRIVDQIKQLATSDGNVLVVNAYIGTQTSLNYKGPEDFLGYVSESEAGPKADNTRMFNMSSEVPDCIYQNLRNDNIFPNLRPGARLFFDVRTKEMLKHVIQVVGSIGSRAAR